MTSPGGATHVFYCAEVLCAAPGLERFKNEPTHRLVKAIQLVERVRSLKPGSKWILILGTALAAAIIVAIIKPVPQPQSYHDFADQRTILGISHGLDVLSNLPFIATGLLGLYFTAKPKSSLNAAQRWTHATLFAGLALTGIGSGYYHLAPDNQRLIWDRLPMTIAMAGFVGALLVDRFGARVISALPLLMAVGIGSVVQWGLSENQGHGDLRWYALYQGMVMIFAAQLLLMFPSLGTSTRAFAIAAIANLAAKVFELLDVPIYQLGGIVSGHTPHIRCAQCRLRTQSNTE
jgi:hypothetical protein